MDTSETYIKMSDCPEIQGQWQPSNGDYCAVDYKNPLNPPDWNPIWILHTGSTACDTPEWIEQHCDSRVWLPRQDQIQEMLGVDNFEDFRNAIDEMFYVRDGGLYDTWGRWFWPDEYKDTPFNSPEQLWLAFYMHKKHKKVWGKNKWKKAQ